MSEERCKFLQRVRAEPSGKLYFDASRGKVTHKKTTTTSTTFRASYDYSLASTEMADRGVVTAEIFYRRGLSQGRRSLFPSANRDPPSGTQ